MTGNDTFPFTDARVDISSFNSSRQLVKSVYAAIIRDGYSPLGCEFLLKSTKVFGDREALINLCREYVVLE